MAYQAMFTGQSAVLGAKEVWEIKAPSKCNFFLWLLLLDRCWTADRRQQHGFQDLASCAICDQEAETADHLIVGCVFM
jgi:hypothetical protein